MNISDTEASTLLAELVALAPPIRQPGDIDARQYAEALHNGMTERYAARLLDSYVKQGKLTRHEVYDSERKHSVVVYRDNITAVMPNMQ